MQMMMENKPWRSLGELSPREAHHNEALVYSKVDIYTYIHQ